MVLHFQQDQQDPLVLPLLQVLADQYLRHCLQDLESPPALLFQGLLSFQIIQGSLQGLRDLEDPLDLVVQGLLCRL